MRRCILCALHQDDVDHQASDHVGVVGRAALDVGRDGADHAGRLDEEVTLAFVTNATATVANDAVAGL
jgi:hypothetical protein